MKKGVTIALSFIFLLVFMFEIVSADNYLFNVTKIEVRDTFNSYNLVVYGNSNNIPIILETNFSQELNMLSPTGQGYMGYLTTKSYQKLKINNADYNCLGNGEYYRGSDNFNKLPFSLTCSDVDNNIVFIIAYINFRLLELDKNQDGFYEKVINIGGSINAINQSSLNQRVSIIESIQSNQSQRLFILESWRSTVNNTILAIQITISNVLLTLTGHTTKLDKHESRIINIENQSSQTPNYFKYLSSSDRKNMVCGYAEERHLTHISDLGWNCDITYRTTRGKETSTCKCKSLE